MPREILRITPEVTYATFASGGVHTIVDLPQSDAFTVRAAPNPWTIRSASSDNLRTLRGSQTYDVAGKLMMYCRPSQAALLASMLTNLTGATCPTLPSFTIDHAIFLEDGSCTPYYTQYLGCMADGGFSVDNSAQGCLMLMNLDIHAAVATTGVTWTTPIYSAYDYAERPFAFEDLVGSLTIAGTGRTSFESLAFSAGNVLKGFKGEMPHVTRMRCFGRNPSVTIKGIYQTTADRAAFNAQTETALTFTFTDALGDTLAFAMGNANYFANVTDNLNIDDYHRQSIALDNLMDPTTGTDFSVTYTAHT